ncbi:MAG: EF-P lysine aminoacylase EpmA [Pseudomonadota bacterium]
MSWRPLADVDTARTRAALLRALRRYFDDSGALEVQTPVLGNSSIPDPNIDSLRAVAPQLRRQFYLQTSPEFAMKRLLAGGYPDIYQIASVFRDGERGARHLPEFTMLEWYRLGATLDDIVQDTEALLLQALKPVHTSTPLTITDATRVRRYDDWLQDAVGINSDAPVDALQHLAGEDFPPGLKQQKQALLDWIFDRDVAAHFRNDHLQVVTHYPREQAALARLDDTGTRALRFEVYLGALELANGFVELCDPEEQRRRFESDLATRAQRDQQLLPLDEEFLAALEHGLPDCAGVALGVDRLLMLISQHPHIDNTVTFNDAGIPYDEH